MKNKLQQKLYNKYPKLFAQRDVDKKYTCMCFGLCCDDGWYPLIDSLCQRIISFIDNTRKQYPNFPYPQFSQIKEKFGLLRVYFDLAPYDYKLQKEVHMQIDNSIQNLIDVAEGASSFICEQCGSLKSVDTRGDCWVLTLCQKCRNIREFKGFRGRFRYLNIKIKLIYRKCRKNMTL